jgi:hypothetical protein
MSLCGLRNDLEGTRGRRKRTGRRDDCLCIGWLMDNLDGTRRRGRRLNRIYLLGSHVANYLIL